jgi:Flp pilus assembly protein TadG
MIQALKKLWRDRRGNTLVIAAGALPLVIGSAGLATDTIQWALWKRQLQRAADSAALAGVHSIVYKEGTRTEVVNAVNRDLTHNNHVGITTTKDYVGQPTSGAYAADPYAVQVTVSVQKKLSFSSIFLSSVPKITTSATATVVATGKYCVISLENTTETGISYNGNATVDLGCGMATNSKGANAVDAGGSSTIKASPISAVGGIPDADNYADGTTLQQYGMKQKDPYASLNAPTTGFNPCANDPNVGPSDPARTLTAGCYKNLRLNGDVTLGDGTYIIDGGNFEVGAQAKVSCNSCTIILTNKSTATNAQIGTVNINAGATINMTAQTTGTYAGILFYQDRRAVDGNGANFQNLINGNASSSFTGAFYFPKQEVFFTGTSGMNTNCVQMVARRVEFSGNTSINNTCPTGWPPPNFDGQMIRLVA